ncbi:hypothetical protein BJ508DRAFT_411857 [Ascobolus immersus RN42]|uniref:CCZ1/INTU/HSP4 first Longin domain-containing protein n=1 Tax=Ascobolus immersus RN42 TaxID=1160509 RepID=A0A3N4IV13_ASCIM|nr:hypothetical protein BJ508DRAFT_411857 [Ascobolus immersus RN42]
MSRELSTSRRAGKQPAPLNSATATPLPKIVQTTPAQLASFTIYNPSLGPTDETLEQQIVFDTSRKSQSLNEKLRQIGLAQGMVEFARGFAKKEMLNTYLTKKARVIIREVEPGWWVLAHIDLTTYPSSSDPTQPEYTARDLSPPSVLLSQVETAYSEYALLHGTFEEGFAAGRSDFTKRLSRFWKSWCWNWEVLLTGDPADSISSSVTRVAKPQAAPNLTASLDSFAEKWKGKGLSQLALHRVPLPPSEPTDQLPKPTQSSSGWTSYLWPTSYLHSPKPTPTTPKFPETTLGTLYTTPSSFPHAPTLWSLTRTASSSPKTSYLTTGGNTPIRKRRKPQDTRPRRSESVSRTAGVTINPPKQPQSRGGRSASVGPWNRRSLPPPPSEPTPQQEEGNGVEAWLGYLTFGIANWGISPVWGGEDAPDSQHTPLPVPPSLAGLAPPNIPPPPSTSPPLPTTSSLTSSYPRKRSSRRGSLLIPIPIPITVDGEKKHLVLYTPPSPPVALPKTGDPFEPPVEPTHQDRNLVYSLIFDTSPTKQTMREIDRDLSMIAAYPAPSDGPQSALSSLNAVKPTKFEFQIKKTTTEQQMQDSDSLYGNYEEKEELTSTFPVIPVLSEEFDEAEHRTRQETVELWRGFLALREMGGGRMRVKGKGGTGGWWIEWEGNRGQGKGSAARVRV